MLQPHLNNLKLVGPYFADQGIELGANVTKLFTAVGAPLSRPNPQTLDLAG
jgi:hypothetical protein